RSTLLMASNLREFLVRKTAQKQQMVLATAAPTKPALGHLPAARLSRRAAEQCAPARLDGNCIASTSNDGGSASRVAVEHREGGIEDDSRTVTDRQHSGVDRLVA